MGTLSNTTVVLGFDMETDVGSWSPFYNGLQKGTPRILSVLDKHDTPATFFFTGDAAQTHPEVVREVSGAGHEVGCHSIYHETVGDPIFDIPGVKPLLAEEVPLRLRRATEWVAESLGAQPVSFRCPRLWGSTAVVNALEDLGYVADASYPLYYYEEQLAPYYPSRSDWTKPGQSTVLEIPNFADMSIASTDPYGRDRDQWPRFRTESAQDLLGRIESFTAFVRTRQAPVVLCFYMHPWEFEPMPGRFEFGEGAVEPHPDLIKNCGEYALEQLDLLLGELIQRDARCLTAQTLAGEWEQ